MKKTLVVLLLAVTFAACQKEKMSTPGPIEGTTAEWDATGENIHITNATTVPTPTGNGLSSSFPDTALAVFTRLKNGHLTAVDDRGWVNGFFHQDTKTRVLAKYQEVVLITSDNTGDGFATITAHATTWQNVVTGKLEVVVFKNGLNLATLSGTSDVTNGTPDVVWGLRLDALTGQPTQDGRGQFWVVRQDAINFRLAAGLNRRLEAVVFQANSTEFAFWQIPNVKTIDAFSQLAQASSKDQQMANGNQSMSAFFPCFQVNGVAVTSMFQNGNLLFVTANGPFFAQTIAISATPLAGFTKVPAFITVGGDNSHPLPDVWVTAPLITQIVFSAGTIFDPTTGTPIGSDDGCFQ